MIEVRKIKLPDGWRWVKLGGEKGVAEIVNGSTPSTDDPDYWGGEVLWATPSDLGSLNSMYIGDTERKITLAGLKSCSAKLLPPGSVLLTSRAPVGNIAIAKKEICTNQGFKSFIPKKNIDSLYLYFAIRKIIPDIQKGSHGNTFIEITKESIQHFEIPLPPTLKDQSTIANELERKMAEVEKMRQAVLRQKEASGAIHEAIFREIFPRNIEANIKKGWISIRLKKVSQKIQYGITKAATQEKIGPKLLRITDIQNGSVDWDKVPYCDSEKNEYEKYLLEKDDILFVRTGATTGKSYLIKESKKALFASYLIRVQCDKKIVNPRYLYSFFQSPFYWELIGKGSRGGTLSGFNASMLSEMIIPIPRNLDEQLAIAKKIEKKTEELNKTSQAIDIQLEAIQALPAAILREVFDFQEANA